MTEVQILGIFGASAIPSLGWLVYFMRTRGVGRLAHGALFFLVGMVAAPIALYLFSLLELSPFYAQLEDVDQVGKAKRFIYTLFGIGPVEEMSKFVAFWTIIRVLKLDARRMRDAILWTTAVSLGFAMLENWYYMLEVQEVVWHRALTLPFNHVLFSSFWGVGYARYVQSGGRRRWLITTLILAFIYHGLYDYILLSDAINPLFVLPIVLLLYIWLTLNFRQDRGDSAARDGAAATGEVGSSDGE